MPIIKNPDPTVSGPWRPESTWLEQRDWLLDTLSSIGDAVITTDTGGSVTFLNPAARALTGWTRGEAPGVRLEDVLKIIDEESRQTVESHAARVLREGAIGGRAKPALLIARDGTERLIEDTATPIRNAEGDTSGVVMVFRDVTERGKAEEALRQSEERFRLLVEGTKDHAIFMLDPTGHIISWNPGAEHIKGYRAEEIIGQHYSCLYPPEAVKAGLHESDLKTAELQGRFEGEGWRIRKDGSRFSASVVITALRDATGKLKGFAKITRDLTERKRVEAALQASELRYRRLFQTAKDGILILDADTGTIIDANPFMSGLLGYEQDEFLGKELWEIGLFRDVEANRAAYLELREKGYIRYENLPLRSKGGREVEVEFVSNLFEVDGRLVAQCNIRDNTERVRLERRARDQAATLADLHRRKDEFLAMLSHELRNPLSPILNAVHLLRLQSGEDVIQQEALRIIQRQVGQMTRIVDDLMEVSRITTGHIRLEVDRLDVRSIVENAVESARPLIDRRRHDLSVFLPSGPIWLHADGTRLEQVVVNLLNNSAKYTDGGGRICLTVRQDGDEMVLSVRDTGVGIAPEMLPQVFDLFSQADRSIDRSQGGLGIGLSLVQHLVEMHQGTVAVQSAGLGQGSEFTVRLPVFLSPASHPPEIPTGPEEHAPRGWRLLVVDDNEDSAEILATLLGLTGHVVRTAYTGQSALDVAATQLPDAVLLDIGLPGINGYEVARRLRLLPQLEGVKIIAMTGYGQDSDRQLAREAGFNSHLTKPIDFVRVQDLLTTLFDPHGSSPSLVRGMQLGGSQGGRWDE